MPLDGVALDAPHQSTSEEAWDCRSFRLRRRSSSSRRCGRCGCRSGLSFRRDRNLVLNPIQLDGRRDLVDGLYAAGLDHLTVAPGAVIVTELFAIVDCEVLHNLYGQKTRTSPS